MRKSQSQQLDEEYDSHEYQQATTYHVYAKELCENCNFDRSKYRLCVKKEVRRHRQKRFCPVERGPAVSEQYSENGTG